MLLLLAAGCRSIPPLAPVDLSAPGWQVRQGQAVWKPSRSRPELAGDLLFATNSTDGCFIQFTKTPFTLVTAQAVNGAWQIEFGDGQHSWSGCGKLPTRFVWFQLCRTHNGGGVSADWRTSQLTNGIWRFEQLRTGESLQGVFAQ